jgi:hypothetical protein
MAFSQSAPRQRTAIACRYCRRRKVRNGYFCFKGFQRRKYAVAKAFGGV